MVAVVAELTLAGRDVADAVSIDGDTLGDSAADDGNDGVADGLAVTSLLALIAVADVLLIVVLVAVAAVLRELPVSTACGDVCSGDQELGVLMDARLAADIAVAAVDA